MVTKRIFKPNGLFSLTNKRSLIDPNHLFLLVGKRSFNPFSILDKRDAEDVWTYKDSDDGDTTPHSGGDDFWAIRGKKEEERGLLNDNKFFSLL